MVLIICSHVTVTEPFMHSPSFEAWCAIINSFYVPLFFLLSGIFESSHFNWTSYKLRMYKITRYVAIFAIFGFLSAGLIMHNWSLAFCLRGAGTTIWFMFTLFWITAIFGLLKKFKFNILIVIFLSSLGYYLARTGHSYYYLGQAFLCLPFYAVGFYFKDFFKDTKFNFNILLISFLAWIVIMTYFYKSPQNVSLNIVTQYYISFYIGAIAGSVIIIELCKLFKISRLAWYGRNSIVPMLVQFDFIWFLAKLKYADNMLLYFLFGLIVCLLSGACIPIFRNKWYDVLK